MLKVALFSYSCTPHLELQSRLVQSVMDCQGWILEDKLLSMAAYRLRFEIALENFSELYGALQQAELQFTREAHRALTEMCTCQKHLPADPEQIVLVDLHVAALKQPPRFRRRVRADPA